MTSNTATFTPSAIKGFLRIAAKQDMRYYLNGVLIEFATGLAVATDGHKLIAGKVTTTGEGSAIIPRELLEAAIKGARRGAEIVVTVDGDDVSIARTDGGLMTFAGRTVGGRFPDWRHTVPQTLSGEAGHYNYSYLETCNIALCEITDSGSTFASWTQNGMNSAAVMQLGDAFAVIMPMRNTGCGIMELRAKYGLTVDEPAALAA